MSATRNIMSSAFFALPFLGYQPVNISNNEPVLQAANIVKQTILGPPFVWPWNRVELETDIDMDEGQDYLIVPDVTEPFGFLERAWVIDAKGKKTEIKVVLGLAEESSKQRPSSIAAQAIDPDGTVTMRVNTIPDQTYTLRWNYQIAPVQMTSLAATWAPIPDYLGHITDWGLLAITAMLTKDVRVPLFGQRFVSHLLGAQDGLSATQRNIFLGNWLDLIAEPQRAGQMAQIANQMRGAN
jgi:hypothetical protein